LAYVACGRFEGFFEYNLQPWDVAAGVCIVKEAGGTVTNFSGGNDCVFTKEIVASGLVQSEMLEIIQQHWQK
jgi:myo-inositol-1(or 4)-monophosphatase